MGPLILSKLLGLNEVQSGVLNIVFKIADDSGMLLIDLKDIRHMLKFVGDNASKYTLDYGNISTQSIGAIQRGLLTLEEQGGENFFAEPALEINDFLQTDKDGRGQINVLASDQLVQSPALYSAFLLWLLSELFEELPEVGDRPKPKIVFFFDEAHLLFDDAQKILLDKIEQMVRLIRSKGVGVYFVTHHPTDLPESVLSQLGNRVQHALRAFTPKEQKFVNAAADTFRPNPELDVSQVITELKVGDALISFLDIEGRPSMVDRASVLPPRSQLGTITDFQRQELISNSRYYHKYNSTFDRESAYEILQKKIVEQQNLEQAKAKEQKYDYGKKTAKKDTYISKMAKSAATSIGRTVGRELIRGLFGILTKR
jgi:DNA helicase HerA-like ATPase